MGYEKESCWNARRRQTRPNPGGKCHRGGERPGTSGHAQKYEELEAQALDVSVLRAHASRAAINETDLRAELALAVNTVGVQAAEVMRLKVELASCANIAEHLRQKGIGVERAKSEGAMAMQHALDEARSWPIACF